MDYNTIMKPTVYLLCGLGGSGKSTYYAQELAKTGLHKLSLDEEVYRRYGRVENEYSQDEYLQLYAQVKTELEHKLIELLGKQQSVVMDYGFWRRASRDYHKALIENHGGDWRLVYLKASPEVLMRRLENRNKRRGANAFPVTAEMLQKFIARFEEPHGEAEEVIEQVD